MKAAHPPQLSVVVPAWNEESYLPVTLAALDAALAESGVIAEVIVVDNDSSDQTATVARHAGARRVHEPRQRLAAARATPEGDEESSAAWSEPSGDGRGPQDINQQ